MEALGLTRQLSGYGYGRQRTIEDGALCGSLSVPLQNMPGMSFFSVLSVLSVENNKNWCVLHSPSKSFVILTLHFNRSVSLRRLLAKYQT